MNLLVVWLAAQSFTHRGYMEFRFFAFPQTAPNDSGRLIGEALLRWEPEVSLGAGWRLLGSIDVRSDTHRQFEREFRLDWQDRRLLRPAFSLRRFSAQYHRGSFTAEIGRQLIRWGKADILNPIDRFAPRDYLNVVDSDVLGVTAARLSYKSVEVVWTPRFTPSRTPLLDQRWTVLPAGLVVPPIGSRIPGRSQFGARWNRAGRRFEHSLVFFEGFHHLPLLDVDQLARVYPRLRLYGGDAAVPLRWFTVKGEAAWFTSATAQADEYVLYVVQLERTHGEWVFIGGYAGEVVTERRNPFGFAPDRGFARAFLGRAGYTIDARRSVAFEAAVRQTGDAVWVKSEYSHLLGRSFRATAGFTLIRGNPADFLGQYRRNSHLLLSLRYSF